MSFDMVNQHLEDNTADHQHKQDCRELKFYNVFFRCVENLQHKP